MIKIRNVIIILLVKFFDILKFVNIIKKLLMVGY